MFEYVYLNLKVINKFTFYFISFQNILMFTNIALISASWLCTVYADTKHQNQMNNMNNIITVSQNGAIMDTSDLTFPFAMPYVQISTDTIHNSIYLSAFPDGNTSPNLYIFHTSSSSTTTITDKDNNKNEMNLDLKYSFENITITKVNRYYVWCISNRRSRWWYVWSNNITL